MNKLAVVSDEAKQIFSGRTLHFYLVLTRDCNLNCKWCYQPKSFRKKESMPIDLAMDSMDWIFENFDEDSVKIMLWGGEPFINDGVLEYLLVAYPQVRFTVVTNGFLIDEAMLERFSKYANNFYVSLSVANSADSNPDFIEKLAPAIELVKRTHGDVHYVSADYKNMVYNFAKLRSLKIPVIRMSAPRDYDIDEETFEGILESWKGAIDMVYFSGKFELGVTNFDRGINSNLIKHLKGLPLSDEQPYFCGCGYNYISIDVNGDVYPCDYHCALKELSYGNVYSGILDENIVKISEYSRDRRKYYDAWCIKDGVVRCGLDDIRLCSRAMCLAENKEVTGEFFVPQKSHCMANLLEYKAHEYLVKKALELKLI